MNLKAMNFDGFAIETFKNRIYFTKLYPFSVYNCQQRIFMQKMFADWQIPSRKSAAVFQPFPAIFAFFKTFRRNNCRAAVFFTSYIQGSRDFSVSPARLTQNPPCRRAGRVLASVYLPALTSFRSSLVRKNFSSSGTRIMQISAAVKPPLYRQKPPWSLGTEVTSR